MRDLVGETLSDRYRLVSRIAGGGMGEVYRGHDLLLDRAVAVKILQPALANDPDLVDRFRLEARAAARLTHPNVVAVYDWGSADDRTYYMVMEFVAGSDLRDLLVSRGCIEPAQAVEIIASVCDALAAAHSEGLVHRDIKPENVLIARSGKVKVADFGIAVVADADRTLPGGGLSGTLRYIAPEQAQGRDARFSSDVWAAGAVLSECLTGRPPLQGSGTELLTRRAHEEPVPPSQFDPSLPEELDHIVLKACAVDPDERYADASDMAQELRRVGVRSLPDAPDIATLLEDATGEIRLPEFQPTSRANRSAERKSGRSRAARRRSRRKLGTLLALLAVIAFLGAAGVGIAKMLGPQEVAVPTVAELKQSSAVSLLEEAGFEAAIKHRKDKFVAEGVVISQKPSEGMLLEGKTVTLVVSSGPPSVNVPAVAGRPLDAAIAKLEAKGFRVDEPVTREYSTLVKEGWVIEQAPAETSLVYGSTLALVVSRGPRPLEVPTVDGLSVEAAKKKLGQAGFETETVSVYSEEVKEGRVVGSDPGGGEIAFDGSTVSLQVSIGPKFESLTMPDVRGMSVGAATSKLESLGLGVRVVQSCGGGGSSVVDTDPIAGASVRENSVIALFVC